MFNLYRYIEGLSPEELRAANAAAAAAPAPATAGGRRGAAAADALDASSGVGGGDLVSFLEEALERRLQDFNSRMDFNRLPGFVPVPPWTDLAVADVRALLHFVRDRVPAAERSRFDSAGEVMAVYSNMVAYEVRIGDPRSEGVSEVVLRRFFSERSAAAPASQPAVAIDAAAGGDGGGGMEMLALLAGMYNLYSIDP
jgi:hypothetical protein